MRIRRGRSASKFMARIASFSAGLTRLSSGLTRLSFTLPLDGTATGPGAWSGTIENLMGPFDIIRSLLKFRIAAASLACLTRTTIRRGGNPTHSLGFFGEIIPACGIGKVAYRTTFPNFDFGIHSWLRKNSVSQDLFAEENAALQDCVDPSQQVPGCMRLNHETFSSASFDRGGHFRRVMHGQHNSSEMRSEEHTSELQSPDHLVCRLLLEKKKIQK